MARIHTFSSSLLVLTRFCASVIARGKQRCGLDRAAQLPPPVRAHDYGPLDLRRS